MLYGLLTSAAQAFDHPAKDAGELAGMAGQAAGGGVAGAFDRKLPSRVKRDYAVQVRRRELADTIQTEGAKSQIEARI